MLGGEVQDEHVGSLEVMNSVRRLQVVGFGEVIAPCDTDPNGVFFHFLYADRHLGKQRLMGKRQSGLVIQQTLRNQKLQHVTWIGTDFKGVIFLRLFRQALLYYN